MVTSFSIKLIGVEETEAQDAIDAIVDHRLVAEKGISDLSYANVRKPGSIQRYQSIYRP